MLAGVGGVDGTFQPSACGWFPQNWDGFARERSRPPCWKTPCPTFVVMTTLTRSPFLTRASYMARSCRLQHILNYCRYLRKFVSFNAEPWADADGKYLQFSETLATKVVAGVQDQDS